MGKGKGKAGRKEAKLIVKKLNQEPKIPGMPKPANPIKKAKKIPSREKKSAINTNPPGPETFPVPMGRPKPFTKSPQHAKWPALFKKHLGVIEAHIRSLDRVMQSMKADMVEMPEKERLEFELGERGNWRVICGMMDRAREVLATAREAAKGILPARALQDKKGLGVAGTNFEPLGPKLVEKATELGYDPTGKGKLGRDTDSMDSEGDSEMTDVSSESESDDAVEEGADLTQVTAGAKVPRLSTLENSSGDDETKQVSSESGSDKENKAAAVEVEANPYFVVDIEPTPVNLIVNTPEEKKSKKQLKEEASQDRKAARDARKAAQIASKTAAATGPVQATDQEVDFAALEARLQAEIAAGTKAQEEAENLASELKEEKKSKKKRRRSSDGTTEAAEKRAKKEKKDKKEKKRKVDDSADGEEVEEGKKKKRKHKVDTDSE